MSMEYPIPWRGENLVGTPGHCELYLMLHNMPITRVDSKIYVNNHILSTFLVCIPKS